jgi:hypothetical protein
VIAAEERPAVRDCIQKPVPVLRAPAAIQSPSFLGFQCQTGRSCAGLLFGKIKPIVPARIRWNNRLFLLFEQKAILEKRRHPATKTLVGAGFARIKMP